MIWALKILTFYILLEGFFYNYVKIVSLFSPLDFEMSYWFYIARCIQAILLYIITKEKKLLYWYGAYALCILFAKISLFGLGVFNFFDSYFFFIIFSAPAFIFTILSCYFIYKLYFLLCNLTKQKTFKYALLVAILEIITFYLVNIFEFCPCRHERSWLECLWLGNSVLDYLSIILFSIGIFKSRFEKD